MEKRFKEITGTDFNVFYLKEKKQLLNYLKSKVYNDLDLEGIVNMSFIELIKSLDRYDKNKSSLKVYLYAIANNLLYTEFNKNKITFERGLDIDIEDEDKYDINIDIEYNKIIDKIQEKGYNELYLQLQGNSQKEIMDALNITKNVLAKRLVIQKKDIGIKKVNITNSVYYKKNYRKKNKERIDKYNKEYREKYRNDKKK